ncbi:MAG: RNA pseudouridine synthase, partial [Alphaproteobacteria bacterium]|nr:RNA pseudouridine synthase [Alphaproteobacteria bacterium]
YLPTINNLHSKKEEIVDTSAKILAEKLVKDYCLINDNSILAINKPPELASQGGTNQIISIDSAIKFLDQNLTDTVNDGHRICHRLDKSTSGVFMIAKNRLAAQKLTKAFAERSITKTYIAITNGIPDKMKGSVYNRLKKHIPKKMQYVTNIDDKEGDIAETDYEVIATSNGQSLIRFFPKTGRMHQIRVHAQSLGCPIAGDRKYNPSHYGEEKRKNSPPYLFLHAVEIFIPNSVLGVDYKIKAPLPDYFRQKISEEFGMYENLEI